MIVQESFDVSGREFVRTRSNADRYIEREGVEYEEACDPAEFNRQYIEGRSMHEDEQPDETYEILKILLGGAE